MDYKEMLKKAMEDMPESVHERGRFEIPKVKGHLEGNKTIITNLNQISEILRRPLEHIFKFLQKELAAPGAYNNSRAVFGSKIPANKINEKVRKYAEEFVLCKRCGKPDTTLEKENEIVILKCQACAEKYSVKTRL